LLTDLNAPFMELRVHGHAENLLCWIWSLLTAAGCGNKPAPSDGATTPTSPTTQTAPDATSTSPEQTFPFITATPNPVPAGPNPGKTTVRWRTNAKADWGEVYVVIPGKPEEKLFTEGGMGSQDAAWINSGGKYEFRLYAGKDHKQILASVIVTKPTEAKK
jgi:hypothetical protein